MARAKAKRAKGKARAKKLRDRVGNTVKPGRITTADPAKGRAHVMVKAKRRKPAARRVFMGGRRAANPYKQGAKGRRWVPSHVSRARANVFPGAVGNCVTPNCIGPLRNQVTATKVAKSLIETDALKSIGLVTGGFVAGTVLPTLIVKGLNKVGLMKGAGGAIAQVGIGIIASVAAGVAVGVAMKDRKVGVLVVAGGLAGVVGALIVRQIDKMLPSVGLSDFPISAEFEEAAVAPSTARMGAPSFPTTSEFRRAAEGISTASIGDFFTEAKAEDVRAVEPGRTRQMSGLGQFVTRTAAEEAPSVGDFVTRAMAEEAPGVEGMGRLLGLSGTEATDDMDAEMDGFGYTD